MLNHHESESDALRRRRQVAKAVIVARSDKTVPSPAEYSKEKTLSQGVSEVRHSLLFDCRRVEKLIF